MSKKAKKKAKATKKKAKKATKKKTIKKKAKKKAKKKKVKKTATVHLVVQEGGCSNELYACSYEDEEDALDAIKGHNEASYNAYGPYHVEESLVKALDAKDVWGELFGLIEEVGGDVAFKSYA
jgi:Fe-S cluster assembly iron-binding protein IscA